MTSRDILLQPKQQIPQTEIPQAKTQNLPPRALINPERDKGELPVQTRVIFTLAWPDYELLCRLTKARGRPAYLWDCAYRDGVWRGQEVTLVAPALGAPYAAMVLEKLKVLGARMVLSLGWCGSLNPQVRIGALVRPTLAQGADGTSAHYLEKDTDATPHSMLAMLLDGYLTREEIPWHAGAILSLDAYYRQTPEMVARYSRQGCLAVDMETAALLAVGRFRGLPVAALLVVSDELFGLAWHPGFKTLDFRRGRERAARVVLDVAARWREDHG